eukprot:SAG25_NODE_194_length_12183_cov_70.943893_16_plen_123_part_00
MRACGVQVLVTGRRMDQGEKRVDLDLWETDARIFNPLADWSWEEVVEYVATYDVPINAGHNFVFRSDTFIDPVNRHETDLPWVKSDLGKVTKPLRPSTHAQTHSRGRAGPAVSPSAAPCVPD